MSKLNLSKSKQAEVKNYGNIIAERKCLEIVSKSNARTNISMIR
jgi:hypothetical protein